MTREELDCGPDITRDEEIAAEVELREQVDALSVARVLEHLRARRPLLEGVSSATLAGRIGGHVQHRKGAA